MTDLSAELFRAERDAARIASMPTVVALLAVGADVSDQVEAEEALRLSEQRFRAITQHSRDLIIVCSREGRILYASAALQTVSGLAPTAAGAGSSAPPRTCWIIRPWRASC